MIFGEKNTFCFILKLLKITHKMCTLTKCTSRCYLDIFIIIILNIFLNCILFYFFFTKTHKTTMNTNSTFHKNVAMCFELYYYLNYIAGPMQFIAILILFKCLLSNVKYGSSSGRERMMVFG